MGYSLCRITDFQNGLISRIFRVLWSGSLHKTTLMFLQNNFSHVFGIFNFLPKLSILQRLQTFHGLQPLENGRFSKWSHFSNICWFYVRFFAQNNFNALVEQFSHLFGIFNFLPKLSILQRLQTFHGLQPLENGRFSKWSHFSNICWFYVRFFAQNNFNALVEQFFASFWHF